MKNLIDKFIKIENVISSAKGPFDLFGLFLRDDSPDRWDLVISSKWTEKDKKATLDYVSNVLKANLSTSELINLSKIVIIDRKNPTLNVIHEAILRVIQIEHGSVELVDNNFFGLHIKRAFIITSQRVDRAVKADA